MEPELQWHESILHCLPMMRISRNMNLSVQLRLNVTFRSWDSLACADSKVLDSLYKSGRHDAAWLAFLL